MYINSMKVSVYMLFVCLLAQFSLPVVARKFVVDNVVVKISSINKTVKVIGPENRDSFKIDSLIIPESYDIKGRKYKTISIGGFYRCNSLVYVCLPLTIEKLEKACFQGCINIEKLDLPPLVKKIPDLFIETITQYVLSNDSLRQSSKLASLTLGENVTSIGDWAFDGNSLQKIVIPEKVKTIGVSAFASLRTLTEVYCLSSIPPAIDIKYTENTQSEVLDWSFQFIGPHNPNLNPLRILYVPYGSRDVYKNAPGWCCFDNIEEF